MTTPYVADSTHGTSVDSVLESWTVPVDVQVDDVIVAFTVGNSGGGLGTIVKPAGWTMKNFFPTTSNMHAYWKIADGTEGGDTITNISQTSMATHNWVCLVIRETTIAYWDDNDIRMGFASAFDDPTATVNVHGDYQADIDDLWYEDGEEQRLIFVGAASTTNYNIFPADYTNPLETFIAIEESGTTSAEIGTSFARQTFVLGDTYVPLTMTTGTDAGGIDCFAHYMSLDVWGTIEPPSEEGGDQGFDERWEVLHAQGGATRDADTMELHHLTHENQPVGGDSVSGAWAWTQDFTSVTSVVVAHNLNGYPRAVVTVAGEQVEADVTYDSVDQITVEFSAAKTGRIQLS